MELSRRQFLRRTVAGGGLLVVSGGLVGCGGSEGEAARTAEATVPQEGTEQGAATTAGGKDYAAQVDEGLSYFRQRADDQLPLVEALLAAIKANDMERAREAYVASRPPYEEIEVLAANFEQTDSDIDARPYGFDEGETSEEFKGFHRIEGLVFRDEDLRAALPYAEGLVESVRTLQEDLARRESFDAATHFEGMIGLANEIPSKKVSSEEETYSDQSLLIFRHNWEGIYSQFKPFAGEVERRDARVVDEVEAAYGEARGFVEPYFSAGTVAAKPYSSVNMGERARIVKIGYRLRDALSKAAETLELV